VIRNIAILLILAGAGHGQPPRWVTFQGEYRNRAGYAYRAMVPPGLSGYRAPAPAPAHGFVIDLGPGGKGRVSVDGSYNASEYRSARIVAEAASSRIAAKGDFTEPPRFQDVRLAGLPAVELSARYRHKTGERRLWRSVSAIRRMKPSDTMGIVYEITLDTPAARVAEDGPIYDAVVRSFRLDPPPRR
jgi:hypothetical protein